ncbi:kinase [Sphingomonas sp. Leaf412]|uniref:ATP-binding protein n=1 Tax=Sphingomonas sp. Leaf412 TaxID=1736370 RepID=UPI0006F706EE|nr:ATP-binding protein [Sphingomonas sp. Leaf412]KQT31186.1 kinase [Sphingomonas sp. Leaf412]
MSGIEVARVRMGLASGWRSITLVVVAILAVVVVGALIVTLGEMDRQRDRALAAQRHSYDIMIVVRTLQGTVARSEASLGRYVISGDQALGQLYFDDWRRAGESIGRLDRLTMDNPEQRTRIAELRAAYRIRGEELALTALNTNYGRNSQALSRYYAIRKGAAMRAMNLALDGIIADERRLLRARTTQARAAVTRTTLVAKILATAGVALVLGVIALGWATMRALAERTVARAEAEAERERADELATAVTEATDALRVQEAQLRQSQKMDAVGKLTGGIAHDFNNMLAVILGGLELSQRGLAQGADRAEVARHIDSAHEGATRAAALTRRLLSFARETAIDPVPIHAAALFTDVADLLDRTLGDGVTVVFQDESRGWAARADLLLLENGLVNLAVNARDAMDGRGTLTLRAEARRLGIADAGDLSPGDYLSIAIRDTGSGMTPDVLDRVFEPFFTTKPVGKGTGLGLSQTFAFARQFGGDVRIDTAPGRGTTVTLLLPRDVTVESAAPVPIAVAAATREPGRSLSILVVEDDPRVLATTIGALNELGHRPVACGDPLDAAGAIAAMPGCDLIVSDVLMPAKTGPEMVAGLPTAFAAVPVLFVTGYAGDAGEGIDLAGRPVLRKPFTLAALDHAIAAAAGTDADGPERLIAAE